MFLEYWVGLLPASTLLELRRGLVQLRCDRVCAVIIVVPLGKHGFADANHFDAVIRVVVGPPGLILVARQARQLREALKVHPPALGWPEGRRIVVVEDPPVMDAMAAPIPVPRIAAKPARPGNLSLIIRCWPGRLLCGMTLTRHRT